jgi:hypothetical protein
MFGTYFRLGFEHIADIAGYDHILFVAALCAVYRVRDWRPLLILVTAFTIGHSITLALATLGHISVNQDLIEIAIPITILVTSILNIRDHSDPEEPHRAFDPTHRLKYILALGFGLVHGLGFSSFLRAVLGGEESIIAPLFAFNVGLELGQVMIAFTFLLISFVMVAVVGMNRREWNLVLSGGTAGVSIILIIESLLGA